MKLLTFLQIAFCLSFASCVKEDKAYDQVYHMYYYQHTNSYRLEVMLDGGDGEPMLSKDESITVNGQTPSRSDGVVYYWEGNGMPDAVAVLKQKSHEYTNTMLRGTIGDCELICPDTVSKSQGFVIMLQNYRPENQPGVLLNSDSPDWFYLQGMSDSIFILPAQMANVPPGEMAITLSELGGTVLQDVAPGNQGLWNCKSENKKKVVVVP